MYIRKSSIGYVVSSSDILISVKEVAPWKRRVVLSPTMIPTMVCVCVCVCVCVGVYMCVWCMYCVVRACTNII